MSSREAFLQRVKSAVAEGNRAGAVPPLPDRSGIGYQGAGLDPVQRFCDELAAAGGTAHIAADSEAVFGTIQSVLQTHNARRILLTSGGLIDELSVAGKLKSLGYDAKTIGDSSEVTRDEHFAADVGITNVHRLVAETGSVVLASKPSEPRFASLLPPVHICLAERAQLLPDLFDLFDLFAPTASPIRSLPPSCLTLITGPSKTGDIELKLVTGVHGPGEIHVVLIESGERPA